jgi:hypothetical protein
VDVGALAATIVMYDEGFPDGMVALLFSNGGSFLLEFINAQEEKREKEERLREEMLVPTCTTEGEGELDTGWLTWVCSAPTTEGARMLL